MKGRFVSFALISHRADLSKIQIIDTYKVNDASVYITNDGKYLIVEPLLTKESHDIYQEMMEQLFYSLEPLSKTDDPINYIEKHMWKEAEDRAITATTETNSYMISTSAGTVTTSITATISGDSEIKNHAYFGAPPPSPPTPPPRDPLKAWVDVYKNGVLVNQQQIYFNALPNSQNSGGVSGSTSYVIDKYTYPQTVINGVIMTNVLPGDFVEFHLYANIQADGSTPPIPSGHIFYHHSGEGHATTTIHSGSILSS